MSILMYVGGISQGRSSSRMHCTAMDPPPRRRTIFRTARGEQCPPPHRRRVAEHRPLPGCRVVEIGRIPAVTGSWMGRVPTPRPCGTRSPDAGGSTPDYRHRRRRNPRRTLPGRFGKDPPGSTDHRRLAEPCSRCRRATASGPAPGIRGARYRRPTGQRCAGSGRAEGRPYGAGHRGGEARKLRGTSIGAESPTPRVRNRGLELPPCVEKLWSGL